MCNTGHTLDLKNVIHMLCIPSECVMLIEQLQLVSYTIYGRSGFKNKLEYTDDSSFPFAEVGSVHCKLVHTTSCNSVSALVFRSGKIKISGGLSKVKENHQSYIDNVVSTLCYFISDSIIVDTKLSMLNAQVKLDLNVKIFRKFLFYLQESTKFSKIQEPTLSGRGRITAAKVYPSSSSRSHLSIDPKGSVQIFAFKSFEELQDCLTLFLGLYDAFKNTIL